MLHETVLSLLFLLAGLIAGFSACSQSGAGPVVEATPVVSAAPQPSQTGPAAARQGTFLAADGLEIAYEERGQGEPALVLVHGWACDRSFWREQLEFLAQDHRVVALDLAGHGASGRGREAWYIRDLADDVVGLVEDLDLQRVVLVGHSMGGPVALMAAASLRGRVVGIVGADTLHNAEVTIPGTVVEAMAAAFEADFPGTMEGFVRSAFPADSDPGTVDFAVTEAQKADPAVAIALLRDFPNLRLAELLSAADVPVRCINAGTNPTATEINRRYGDFEAVILPGAGHFLMLERPAEFNTALSAVLESLKSSPESSH